MWSVRSTLACCSSSCKLRTAEALAGFGGGTDGAVAFDQQPLAFVHSLHFGHVTLGNLDSHPFRRRVYYLDGNGIEWEFIQYLSEKPEERND